LAINGHPAGDVQSFIKMVISLPYHKPVKLLALEHVSGQIGYAQVIVN
jgi:hypothetical protein